MRRRIANTLQITVTGVDLTEAENIEFYVKTRGCFFQYTPTVTDATHMTVTVPFEDAMKLDYETVKLQFAFTLGVEHLASEDIEMPVEDLIKEAGYCGAD